LATPLAITGFDPRAIMDDRYIEFKKSMESIGTIQNGSPSRVTDKHLAPMEGETLKEPVLA
jgi:hypothetical protein